MDPSKVQMKDIGHKMTDDNTGGNINKDMSKHLENLNKISESKEPLPVLKLKEHDIELLKKELDLTNDEAKNQLIKYKGDVEQAIEAYLNDFYLE